MIIKPRFVTIWDLILTMTIWTNRITPIGIDAVFLVGQIFCSRRFLKWVVISLFYSDNYIIFKFRIFSLDLNRDVKGTGFCGTRPGQQRYFLRDGTGIFGTAGQAKNGTKRDTTILIILLKITLRDGRGTKIKRDPRWTGRDCPFCISGFKTYFCQ